MGVTSLRLQLLVLVCTLSPLHLVAQQAETPPLTLGEALAEARAANAQLPVAALGARIAQTQVREAQASRLPRLSLNSSANVGGPIAYTTSQGLVQLVSSDTLFAGGLRRANLRAAEYRALGARAGFRVAEKDVDLAVRLRFSEFLKAQSEIAFRQQGIERLRSYLSQVQGRKAAGQPIGSDVLTTQVRLGTDAAALFAAQQAMDEARLELNDLLGRNPATPLAVVPLPSPEPPTALVGAPSGSPPAVLPGILPSVPPFIPPGAPTAGTPGAPWMLSPDVRQAEANSAAAQAGVAATRSERRPAVEVSANLGALPVFGRSNPGTGPNGGTGFGGALVFSLSWPLWDAGVYRARLNRAQLEATQARASQVVVQRQSRLSYEMATAQLARLYQQVETWGHNVPLARDAYLQTQSIYNGGAGSALAVLDAYTSWINANEAYANAVLLYRQAEANYLRWGTP